MPCHGGPSGSPLENELTRLLCEAIAKLTPESLSECSLELRRWKEDHDIADAKRRVEESKAIHERIRKEYEAQKRAELIATLTLEQRKLLGV